MKRVYSFILAGLALVAASCNKEVAPVETPEENVVVFNATADNTKTTLTEGNKSEWVAGDKITVFNGEKSFEFATSQSGPVATFQYKGSDFTETNKYMAVYPSAQTADLDAKTVTAVIPTAQPSCSNTYNPDAAIAVAYTENDTDLYFKNAVALIKFTVKGNNIKQVVFFGNNDEKVSGNVTISLNENSTIKSVAGDTNYAEIWADTQNHCFAEGPEYYLAVVPQLFTKGFTVQVKYVDGGEEKTHDLKTVEKEYNLKPNTILNVGELSYGESVPAWAVAGSFNNWNATANPMKLEGDYYVIKNVTKLHYTAGDNQSATGFKFVTYGNWKGTGANNGKMATGAWEYIWGDNGKNIYVDGATENDAFDIYVNPAEGDNGQFIIVPAGEELPKPAPAWAVAGSFNNWNATANPMELEGDYYVIKNVTKLHYTAGDNQSATGFKFVTYGNWKGTGANNGKMATGAWEYIWGDNGKNIYVDGATENDAFDIYVNPAEGDNGQFIIVPAGEDLPSNTPDTPDTPDTPTPDTPDTPDTPSTPQSVRIYISNAWGWSNLWCWDSNSKQIFGNVNWPGTKYHGESNGYYYWDVPTDYIGKTVSMLAVKVENGQEKEKSNDFTGVTLDRDVYFHLEYIEGTGVVLVKEDK